MCCRKVKDGRFSALGYYAVTCLILCCRFDADGVTLFSSCPALCRCIITQSSANEERIFKNVVCKGVVKDLRLLHVPQKTQWLDLSDTSLQSIPSYFFLDHGVVELTELDLSNNNLSYIDRHTFIGLNVLKYLDLSFNKILYFDPNSLLYNELLTHIYLKGTDIPIPQEGSLIVSRTLKLVDVSDCGISTLPSLVFSEIPYLLVLNISRNPIGRVDVKILDNLTWLRELDISKTNLKCDQHFAPLADWAKSYSVRLTGYPCLNSHNDEAVFRTNRKKPTTSNGEEPEWPTPESAVEYVDDNDENAVTPRTSSGTVGLNDPEGTESTNSDLNETDGSGSALEVTFWAHLFSDVNWTFWLVCLGCFTLGIALTIAMGYGCYSCCGSSEEQPNELVSAGDEFQLVHSELGYEPSTIPDEPPSYSSLFSSRYQKVLPTPQLRYGQR